METEPVKRKSRIESEKRIFKAGIEAFSKHGYEATSLKQIAQKAKINEAMIIRYFGSKEGLLTAIMVEFVKTADDPFIQGLPESRTLKEEIENFLLWHIRYIREHRDFALIAMSRSSIDPKMRKELVKHVMIAENPKLVTRLKKFKDRGEIADSVDLSDLSHLINLQKFSYCFSLNLIQEVEAETLEKRASEFASLIAKGLGQ